MVNFQWVLHVVVNIIPVPLDGKDFEIWKRESGSDLMKQWNSPQIPAWHEQLWYSRIRIPLWCSDQILWHFWKYILRHFQHAKVFFESTLQQTNHCMTVAMENGPFVDSYFLPKKIGETSSLPWSSLTGPGGPVRWMATRIPWQLNVGNSKSCGSASTEPPMPEKQPEIACLVPRVRKGHTPNWNFHFWQILTLKKVFFLNVGFDLSKFGLLKSQHIPKILPD